MIKVLHVLHSVGGVEVYLRLVSENVDASKISSVIVHGRPMDNREDYLDKNGNRIKEYYLPIQREISPIKDFRCIWGLVKILKKEKPNVVHAHSAKGGIIGRFASLFYPVTVLHTPHAFSYLSQKGGVKQKLFLFIERLFKNFNSILLATSISEQIRGIKEVGYAEENTIVFNNCIKPITDLDLSAIHEYNLPKKYICTVGRPSYQKNIEMMVEVIKKVKAKIPDIHLVVMGVGVVSPNTDKVNDLIEKYALESNITLIKWMERKKIFGIISKAQLYLSTARYEGMPYAMIESLALSKAIIATDCDGNRDLVYDGQNGFLISQGDDGEMAGKVIELYQNEDVRERYGKASQQLFNKGLNIENTIQKLEQVYSEYSSGK
ncbi:glycosyltransferase [Muricauda sp. 334s03]|uniref:Glycosyltransferase n=1 Tax=Flagellimonas yonaguniensis TaxID=3031325 RepID=A0ABT5XU96_9FLAO|nr:glycosyltransferase [[Muricauda] yonaguniensis]MDF0714767.1 glycosyltransferase [[Muricauda] yonaguniensis]